MKKLWERVREFVTMERERERLDQIQDPHDRAELALEQVIKLRKEFIKLRNRVEERTLDRTREEEPIVVTGGDTNHGEVVRGPVLLIHYEEAEEDAEYARRALDLAFRCKAPVNVLDSLIQILTKVHGIPASHLHGPRTAKDHIRELEERKGEGK